MQAGSLDELARKHPAIAIHFWARWNAYDPLLDRSIRAIEGQFAGRLQFVSCDVDRAENHELCRQFGVANLPSVGILVSGHPPQLLTGRHTADELASGIETRLRGHDGIKRTI